MREALRATAILSSSSIVTILVGLASSKAWALLLGPTGHGYMALLQSLLGLSSLIAGMGIGVGVIRSGANALAREDARQVAALRRASWILFWVLGGLAVFVLIAFSVPLSVLVLGGPEYAGSVMLMGVGTLISLGFGIQAGILNTYRRLGALAKIGILNSVLSFGVSLALVWIWRERGVAPALVAGTMINCALCYYFLRREVEHLSAHPTRQEVFKAARSLLCFGGPYTASMMVGGGVQLAMPILVLHFLGTESVGFYKAATAVSLTYLGFLLKAMAQDYYPRVSAASDQPTALVQLVNQQHRLIMLLSVPMILGTLALVPYLIPLIYSAQYYPAVEVLEWQLVGDLFKFSSWTMAFVILARSGSSTFFFVEFVGGLATVVTGWLGMHWFGLTGLGIGFLTTYIIYYLVVWVVVHREIPLFWTIENKLMMLAALLAALVILTLPFVGLEGIRTPVALSLAGLAGLGSLYAIQKELGGIKGVLTVRPRA